MRSLLTAFIVLLSFTASVAQSYRLSTEPQAFITDVQALMASTRNPASIEVANAFQSVFGQLPEAQKAKVIANTQLMLKARLKSRPHFEDYFAMITAAYAKAGMRGNELDNLLAVTEKVMQKTDSKAANLFLSTAAQFLQTNQLYVGKSNRLGTFSDNFAFEFVEVKEGSWEEPKAPEPVKEEPKKAEPAKKTEPAKKAKDDWASGWGDDWGSDWDKPAKDTPAKAAAADDWGSDSSPAAEEPETPARMPFYPTPQPVITGAVLTFTNADLAIGSAHDSTIIEKTSGSVLLTQGIFVGKGGTLRWATAGHPDKDISCALGEYNFDITKPAFQAELVTIHYPEALKEPVQGNLDYKSVKRRPNLPPDYPRFISLTNDARLNNIGENIQYRGGFSLAGQRMLSNCVDETPATILVQINGAPKFRAVSRSYALGDSLIASQRAAISIYQGQDSITHPGIRLKYNRNRQFLTLIREAGGFKHATFFDSYHKLDIKAEVVKWDMATSKVDFSILNARNEIPVVLESEAFFTPKRYYRSQGVMRFHPLQATVNYAELKKVNKFYVHDMAAHYKLPINDVKAGMSMLASETYIDYNNSSGLVVLKPRAFHYVSSAKGKKDFDNIQIEALNQAGQNATLDLETNDLTVRGVERFYLSDSLGVYVEPKDKEITIKRNRDMVFNGTVYSGNFQFNGTDFVFDYNNFLVDMEKIDKISFVIKEQKKGQKGGKAKANNKQSFGSPEQHSVGRLYINKPTNKSNRKHYASYPFFDAKTGTNMYFNRPEVLGGAYDLSVFFKVPAFVVDSLDRNSGNSAIDFAGEFVSGGIFPTFSERLHVMPDYSLGFDHNAPTAGYPVYEKGRFFNKLTLNAGGIRGIGKLTYLSATLLSDDFVFYLDSATTRPGKTATIAEGLVNGVFIPDATVSNYWLRWAAPADSMHIGSIKDPISLYKNNLTLKGNVTLTPSGLYGRGVAENALAKITAPFYHFKENFFDARHGTFAIKTDGKKPALRATDAHIEFDIAKRIALFNPEKEGVANITFPALQYKTSLSGGKADFNTKVVTMKMPEGSDIRKSYFYSTHPGQDSLVFQATGATYDMNKTTLNVYGVPYIEVLDAKVMPDSGKVFIVEGAVMKTLHNASIVMDTARKYHSFHRAELDVLSRRRMSGTAMYKYMNAGDKPFDIPFNQFLVDSAKMSGGRHNYAFFTRAFGYVEEAQEFYITPGVLYKGDVIVRSDKRDLSIKGYAKFAFREDANSDWFAFQQDVNPASVGFSVDKLTDADGSALITGLHISSSTNTPYSTFASKKLDDQDLDVLKVSGLFSYDKDRKEYVIGHENKVLKKGLQGNIMRYNAVTSATNFEGSFQLLNPDKNFSMAAGGYGIGRPDSNSYELKLTIAIDPNMPQQAVDAMGQRLADHPHDVAHAITSDTMLLYRMAEFVGDKAARDYRKKMLNGYVAWPKFSSKLQHHIMLSDVNMHWSQEQNAWYSNGHLGVANIGKYDVNAMMLGYLEVRKTPLGDAVSLYLETPGGTYFYINFAENALTMISSDDKFRDAVAAKASKTAITPKNFGMQLGEVSDKDIFLDYFRSTYLGQKSNASVRTPVQRMQQQQQNAIPEAAGTTDEAGRKKKKKDDTELKDPGSTIPAAPEQSPEPSEPAESKKKKKEKEKEKKKKEESLFPDEAPAEGQPGIEEVPAEEGKKKKDKKKKKEEATEGNEPEGGIPSDQNP